MAEDKSLNTRFIKESGLACDIATLIEPIIEDIGFRLVRVIVSGRDGTTLQIMAERADGTMTIEDCGKISNELSPFLDSHDPMPGEYHLEVSSPGIDRPLVRGKDFLNWQGFEAKIELKQPIDGRKRFKGNIDGLVGNEVQLTTSLNEGEEPVTLGFKLDMISNAKLVMNDKLLKCVETRDMESQ